MFRLQHLRDTAQVVLMGSLGAGLVECYSNDSLCNVVEVKLRSLRHHNAFSSCDEIYRERETGLSSIMCRTTSNNLGGNDVRMSTSVKIHEESAAVESQEAAG